MLHLLGRLAAQDLVPWQRPLEDREHPAEAGEEGRAAAHGDVPHHARGHLTHDSLHKALTRASPRASARGQVGEEPHHQGEHSVAAHTGQLLVQPRVEGTARGHHLGLDGVRAFREESDVPEARRPCRLGLEDEQAALHELAGMGLLEDTGDQPSPVSVAAELEPEVPADFLELLDAPVAENVRARHPPQRLAQPVTHVAQELKAVEVGRGRDAGAGHVHRYVERDAADLQAEVAWIPALIGEKLLPQLADGEGRQAAQLNFQPHAKLADVIARGLRNRAAVLVKLVVRAD
mmetsp:Transcript_16093/g.46553  ORF Transcript_16093/g.46553 Transcript_16093/m.46553 type:complete len:291 (+) Transcript_16093:778-1650(+)